MGESSTSSEKKLVLIDELSTVSEAIADISKEALIAVDGEGYNLGRTGTLDILTIATRDKTVYLFDITTLGQGVFGAGLKGLLEGDTCEKLMFDCRNDADVLLHKHQVKLGNVLDLQLLDVVHRQDQNLFPGKRSRDNWNTAHDNVGLLWGYKKCLDIYLKAKELVAIKERGTEDITKSKTREKNVWTERPLKDALKQYCVVDTLEMFSLYDLLSPEKDLSSIRAASGRYVDYIRGYPVLPTNTRYVFHAYLPHNILSVPGTSRNCQCVGCKKQFDRDEFSKLQLRNGNQMCRVCKVIKGRRDDARNWKRRCEEEEQRQNDYEASTDWQYSDDSYYG